MGKPRKIELSSPLGHQGIQIEYVKSKKMLHFFGWYGGTGLYIEQPNMSLEEFCERLGIKR